MPQDLDQLNLFDRPPFHGLRGVGYYNHTRPWHWQSRCDYDCFYHLVSGTLTVTDASGVRTLQAGDTLLLRRGEDATLGGNVCAYYYLSFYCDADFDLKIDPIVRNSRVDETVREMCQAWQEGRTLLLCADFLRLLDRLSCKTVPSAAKEAVSAVADYIRLHYNETITVSRLCRLSGYSPAHLRRLFLRQYSLTPGAYILARRIEAARQLLVDRPELGMEAIAEELGMCSGSYFCKVFRASVGVTPQTYRTRCQQTVRSVTGTERV